MAPQTTLAPFVDPAETFGSGYSIPQTTTAPFFDSGVGFAPHAVRGTATAGLVVKVGATELDQSLARSFRDELVGTGSFSITLANDDPDMPAFDDVVSFVVDGEPRFAGVVESKNITTYTPSEDVAELTQITGRGSLALLDSGLVEPVRGLDAYPVEIVRTFSWPSLDYDSETWPNSKRIRRSDVRTALFPNRYSPEWWPSPQSYWIWADQADVSEVDAPLGRCLFRHAFTTADDEILAIFVGLDNFGTVYLDGARICDTENDASSYTMGRRITFPVSAGDHVLAANVKNLGRGGGFNFAIWTVDDEGLLDAQIEISDYTTRCLAYPDPPPGFTAGRALRIAVEEAQARDELQGITLDFDDLMDSDGEPWTSAAEITVEVGRSVLEFTESLTDWLIDAQMAPGSPVLRAWNWGTRGSTPGVTIAATTDPLTSEVAALSHAGRHARVNRLVIRYRQGYTEVTDTASITANDQLSAFLDLGEVDTEAAAQAIGEQLLALRADPSYAHTLTLSPVGSQPYADFNNGDYVTHPDESGSTDLSRVRSIVLSEDDEGIIEYVLQLNDIREETESRHDNWLKRQGMGSLAGGARVVSRSGEPLSPAVRISTTNVAEFSQDNATLSPTASPVRPADSSGNLIEVYGRLTTAGSSTTAIDVEQNGAVIATLTWTSGVEVAEVDLEAAKCFRNIDEFQLVPTSIGTGAEGLDVQIRAI